MKYEANNILPICLTWGWDGGGGSLLWKAGRKIFAINGKLKGNGAD